MLHQKRLNDISKRILKPSKISKKYKLSKNEKNLKDRVIKNKLKNHEFRDSEFINELNRANRILMTRLVEISKGDQLSIPKHKRRSGSNKEIKTSPPKYKLAVRPQNLNPLRVSLNYSNRISENNRIKSENQKIAERILSTKSHIMINPSEIDFKEHLKRK